MKRKRLSEEVNGKGEEGTSRSTSSDPAYNFPTMTTTTTSPTDPEMPPMKRRRGRPPGSKNKPKSTINADEAVQPSSSPPAPSTELPPTTIPSRETAIPAVKRGRGRPPGSKNKRQSVINGDENEGAPSSTPTVPSTALPPTTTLSHETNLPAVKRGRGRPPGSKNKRQSVINGDEDEGAPNSTPPAPSTDQLASNEVNLPSMKRGRGRPPGSKNKPKPFMNGVSEYTPQRNNILATPTKPRILVTNNGSPAVVANADRSARRKSVKRMIDRTVRDDVDEESDVEEEGSLAQRIWAADQSGEGEGGDDGRQDGDEQSEAPTPIKRGRGRPKGSRNKRTPTPPGDLPPHERYFFQNRPGAIRTSDNTLSSLSLLNHEEYFSLIESYVDPHQKEQEFLQDLHARSFSQWRFELQEGFNICLYGFGSKQKLVLRFAKWLDEQHKARQDKNRKIVVVNGYVANLTIRDVLNTLAGVLLGPNHTHKLGSQPNEMVESLLSHITHLEHEPPEITLLIHTMDSPSLRRPASQSILARLASQPYIQLLCTADHPSFALLWDSSLRSTFNFVFHDCTTFESYKVEIDVVDAVNDLLGRSGRRITGKEGVGFVLKSLPENARNLYRVLICEQLAALDGGLIGGRDGNADGDNEDEEGDEATTTTTRNNNKNNYAKEKTMGIESRTLYRKAAEEFICPNEMTFRTLLREFYDHQMIESRRDAAGEEVLWVPFRRDELDAVLDELL